MAANIAAENSNYQDPRVLDTLALACRENGKVDEAIRNQRRALSLVALAKIKLRREMDARLMEYVKANGDPGLTQEIYGERVRWLRTQSPQGHAELATSLCMLGGALMQEGAFEQAESALLESWKLLGEERSNGVEGGLPNDELVPRAREVADYIIGLYDSWEKARPGIGMSTKAATWRTTRSSMKSAAETGGP